MKVLTILNPSAQDFKAQKLWGEYQHKLPEGFDLVKTSSDEAENTHNIQQSLQNNEYDRIILIGGDGTIHASINVTLNFFADLPPENIPTIAVIPFGTANDIAKSINLPNDYEQLFEIAISDDLVPFDVGLVSLGLAGQAKQCYFLDSVSVGMDADILNARSAYRTLKGYLSYVPAVAERLLKQRSFTAQVDIDGQRFQHSKAFNIIVNNAPVYAGEIEIPGSRCDDGLLDVCVFDRGSYTSKLTAFAANKIGIPDFTRQLWHKVNSVGITLPAPQKVQIDGEYFGEADMIICEYFTKIVLAAPARGN